MILDNTTSMGERLAVQLTERSVDCDAILGISTGGHRLGRYIGAELGVPVGRLAASVVRLGDGGPVAGAVASDGCVFLDDSIDTRGRAHLRDAIANAQKRARAALEDTDQDPLLQSLEGATTVLVDDGHSHEAVAVACLRNAAAAGATTRILATPTVSPGQRRRYTTVADDVVTLDTDETDGAASRQSADEPSPRP